MNFVLIAETIAYIAATGLAFLGTMAVYHLVTALVATSFGIRVLEIQIGYGPTLFKRIGKAWTVRVAAFPLGGSTKFQYEEELDRDSQTPSHEQPASAGSYENASALAQILVALSGPVAWAFLGLLFLAIPIWGHSRQLEVCPPDASMVTPCGVPGLRFGGQPSSWASQVQLIRETAIEFHIRLLTFKSLANWGGWIAMFVTCGKLGTISFAAWLTSVGAISLWMAVIQLIPLPGMNGGRICGTLFCAVTGLKDSKRTRRARAIWAIFALVVSLVFVSRVVWTDLRWVGHACFG